MAVTKKEFSIFHGPTNVAGIGRYLADWQRNKNIGSDFIVYSDFTQRNNNHYNLHLEKYGVLKKNVKKFFFFLHAIRRYNLFHFYFSTSLLPFNLDLPILKIMRKKIVMTYCGSDIRLVEVEKKRNPYTHLLPDFGSEKYDWIKKIRLKWHELWVDRFTASRALYDSAITVLPNEKVVHDIWLNNTMDLSQYTPKKIASNSIPVLVHAPSNKAVKGTRYIEEVIEKLESEGHQFEYLTVTNMKNDEAQKIYRDNADIIIDQLLLGTFGSLAVEAMYYSKPVLTYISPEVRKKYYPDCPIVDVTIKTLKDKLIWLIYSSKDRERIGEAGRKYVEKHFDREKINQRIWKIYQNL